MATATIEVIEERVSEHRKSIDSLLTHTNDLTNSYATMGEVLKRVDKDLATLFSNSQELSKKIEVFSLSLKEKEIKQSMIKNIIFPGIKYVFKTFFFILVLALAFENDNYEHLHKIIGL